MREETIAMNCSQFAEVLHDLDRPGTRGMELREQALSHAESCSRCAQILTESESLDFALQALGVRDSSAQAPPRVELALIQEFHRVKSQSSRQGLRRGASALAVAAAVLLALGVSLRRLPVHAPGQSDDSIGASIASPPTTAHETEAQISAAVLSNSEYASNYVPLPYADDPQTLEGGAIVHVELTRVALTALGLPVVDMGTADQIPADIVLSEDGIPQAIRLHPQPTAD